MCWADRTAVAILGSFIAFIWVIETPGSGHLWFTLALWGDFLKVFLIIWAPLRLIDFALGGPGRRHSQQRSHSPVSRGASASAAAQDDQTGTFLHRWRPHRLQ